jgi:hypothetical protein
MGRVTSLYGMVILWLSPVGLGTIRGTLAQLGKSFFEEKKFLIAYRFIDKRVFVQKISELNYSMVRGERELDISNYRDFIFMVMPKLNELFAAEYDKISHEVEELIKSKEKEQRLVSKNDPVDLYLQELQKKAKRVKALAQNEEQENLRMIKTFNGNFVEYGS